MRRIEASRRSLGTEVQSLKSKLHAPSRVVSRVRKTAKRQPLALIGGTVGAGFLLSRLRRRKPKMEKRKRGVVGFLLGALFAALKPTLMRLLTSQVRRSLIHYMKHRRLALPGPAPATDRFS
ncbi:hypothetical protein [Haloferula sargassicola]|uniref:Uncharacterized protein n=1 Tax=Haloferula sargassicola TaxID=490096 RepID=A0ABP9UT37_9BACT